MIEPIRVVLVDDHAIVRQGVRAFLEMQTDFAVVGEARSGAEAIELVLEQAPDVVLMDLLMPDMDGVEATRHVKQASPCTHIVVLTSYHQDEHIFPVLQAGALSYILKDADPEELADAIRLAARGEAIFHPQVAARIGEELRSPHRSLLNPFVELSARELDVLRLVAAGLHNNEIAGRLGISERTAKNHVSNILSKLHLTDRTQAAVYAWRKGLVRRES